ncbi:MAG: hypothetical protein AAGA48_38230, partial [Myxococcota bacterium]
MLEELASLYRWDATRIRDFAGVRSRMMMQGLLFAGALALAMVPIQLIIGPAPLVVLPLLFLMSSGLAIILVRAERQQLAAWFVLATWLVIATATVSFVGTLPGPTGLFFVPGVIASVLWLRTPGALLMIVLHLAILALAGPLNALFTIDLEIRESSLHGLMIGASITSVAISSMLAGSVVQVLSQVQSEAQVRALEAQAAEAQALKASEAKSAFLAT